MATASTRPWLLEPNIVSELARPNPCARVLNAFGTHTDASALPMIVWHELLVGVLRLPEGQRKDAFARFVQAVPGALPKLPYEEPAARRHAELRAAQQIRGRPLAEPDAQIAATALAQGMTLVTRNTRDFQHIDGLKLANWFEG